MSSPTYVCVMRRIRPSRHGYTRRPNGQLTDASAVRSHTAPGLLDVTSGNNLCMKKEIRLCIHDYETPSSPLCRLLAASSSRLPRPLRMMDNGAGMRIESISGGIGISMRSKIITILVEEANV